MRNELGIVTRKETKKINTNKKMTAKQTRQKQMQTKQNKQTNKKSSKRINLIERLMLEFPYIKVRKIFQKHKRVPRLEFDVNALKLLSQV